MRVFTPDGRGVFTNSGEKPAVLWDTRTGRKIRTFGGDGFGAVSGVDSVEFSPDGTKLLRVGRRDDAVLIDARSGNVIRSFAGRPGYQTGATLTPDGRQVVTGSYDGTIAIWDARTGAEVRKFTASEQLNTVAVRPDGRTAVTSSSGEPPHVWNLQSGDKVRTVGEPDDECMFFAFSRDDRRIAGAMLSGGVTIWDAANGERLLTVGGARRARRRKLRGGVRPGRARDRDKH